LSHGAIQPICDRR